MWWIKLYRDFNLTWNIFVVQLVVLSLCTCVNSILSLTLPAVHWNSSNPMFKTSNNDHIIEVNLYDEIDFVCPYYDEEISSDHHEYYIIHKVTKEEYDDCNLYTENNPVAIINCENPRRKIRFTMLFDPYLAIPGSPQFKAGGTYYFITTSTGRRDEIYNPYQGACLYKNMKVTIKVCCETTTNASENTTATSTTSLPSTHNATQLSTTSGVSSTTQTSTTIKSTPEPSSSTTVAPTTTTTYIRWWRFTTTIPAPSSSNEIDSIFSTTPESSENEAYSSGATTRVLHKSSSVLLFSLLGGLISVLALTRQSYYVTSFAIITSFLVATVSVTFQWTTGSGS